MSIKCVPVQQECLTNEYHLRSYFKDYEWADGKQTSDKTKEELEYEYEQVYQSLRG